MSDVQEPGRVSNRSLTLRLLGFGFSMLLFCLFALPPLYDAFCEVTGLGGKTAGSAAEDVVVSIDENRDLGLEFVTTVNQHAPWEFRSAEAGMKIHPGQLYEATFIARNLSDEPKVAQAVPSVSPAQAASYFKKLECFCFTAQKFAAGEEKEMLVRFLVGSDLPEFIDTITLSYTFFDASELPGMSAMPASAENGAR